MAGKYTIRSKEEKLAMALATIAAVAVNTSTAATAQARNTMSIMKRNIQSKNIVASAIPTLALPRNRTIP